MRVSVVIPLLNEQATLRELHARLAAMLAEVAPEGHQIIFVNDGSTDGSAALLESLAKDDPNVVSIEFRRTFGKAAGLAAGFREARGDVIVMIDADLQDVPEEIPRLLERIAAGADVVTGRKYDRRDPWTRRFASRLFNAMISLVTRVKVRDVNSGLKALRRCVALDIPMQGELHRYIPVLASARGYAIEEIDVSHLPRRHGQSRYGWSRYLAGLLDTFTVLMLTRYDKRPLHFFGLFGFALTGAGGAVLAYLTAGWFMGQWISNRPLFTLGVLLVILGLQSVFFGILAELVVLSERDGDAGYTIRRVIRGTPEPLEEQADSIGGDAAPPHAGPGAPSK